MKIYKLEKNGTSANSHTMCGGDAPLPLLQRSFSPTLASLRCLRDGKPSSFVFIIIRRGGSWWYEAKNCRVSRCYASDQSKKMNGLELRIVIRNNVE